ncbi:hypothetical protein EVAR_102968_1 [Eumeta japonica]|uniref:Uncharacterized protein n=1 Tax=Eumeta variegata TaxID=151549 RepID=A0A4C1UPP2_EUMVA|nr:hypothetical protein EVAR_102968_1 [Eumeta japonica]
MESLWMGPDVAPLRQCRPARRKHAKSLIPPALLHAQPDSQPRAARRRRSGTWPRDGWRTSSPIEARDLDFPLRKFSQNATEPLEDDTLAKTGTQYRIFLRRCPNAETLSRHEAPDCGAKRGITHAQ